MFAAVHESGYDPSKFHVISCLITTRLDWIHGVLGFGSWASSWACPWASEHKPLV